MKLGIMQPYFFPYLGYFDLINYTDKWIVFDDVQYIRHGWINRNRILHPHEGWSYIVVPVNSQRESRIKEVGIVNEGKWKARILGQLQPYKKRAPYFVEIRNLVEDCLNFDCSLISYLNVYALNKICSYIDIKFNYSIFSEMSLELESIEKPGDWAFRISQALGANEYVNPPGGEALFDKEQFTKRNINLIIRHFPLFTYESPGFKFIPNLSIIDVLMWNAPEEVKKYLDERKNWKEM